MAGQMEIEGLERANKVAPGHVGVMHEALGAGGKGPLGQGQLIAVGERGGGGGGGQAEGLGGGGGGGGGVGGGHVGGLRGASERLDSEGGRRGGGLARSGGPGHAGAAVPTVGGGWQKASDAMMMTQLRQWEMSRVLQVALVCLCVRACACTCVRVYVCVPALPCILTHTHARTHAHAHTQDAQWDFSPHSHTQSSMGCSVRGGPQGVRLPMQDYNPNHHVQHPQVGVAGRQEGGGGGTRPVCLYVCVRVYMFVSLAFNSS